jgi:hypothetical protein
VAKHPCISSVSARSKVAPSNAVSSNPNSHAPLTGPGTGPAAVARNKAWNTFSCTRALACDNADPLGTTGRSQRRRGVHLGQHRVVTLRAEQAQPQHDLHVIAR